MTNEEIYVIIDLCRSVQGVILCMRGVLMSEKVEKYVTCPKCEQQVMTEIVCSLNTENDKDARSLIFDEKIFRWKCKKCGFQTKLFHPVLYSDIKNKFMVYYIPKIERKQISDERLELEFSDLSYVKKRVVASVNSMKEKIVLFEKNIDDLTLELTKSAVSEVVAKSTSRTVHSGYFMSMDEDKLTFQYFVGSDRRSYIQTISKEVFHRSSEIVKKYFSRENQKPGFLNINDVWAKEALKKYKSNK